MNLRTRDKLSSAWWLVFSILICAGSLKYSMGTPHQPGPGFFPFLGGAALGILSLLNFIRTFSRSESILKDTEELVPKKGWKNIVLVLMIFFAYPILLSIIGFAPTTFILFVVLLRFIEPLPWPTVIKVSVTVVILACLIFQFWLEIQFPKGIFGI